MSKQVFAYRCHIAVEEEEDQRTPGKRSREGGVDSLRTELDGVRLQNDIFCLGGALNSSHSPGWRKVVCVWSMLNRERPGLSKLG